MLNKFKSFVKGNQVETGTKVVEIKSEFNVEDVMIELIAKGEVVEEISVLESIALDVMGVLKEVPILFKRVMRAKPEDAYKEVSSAVNYLVNRKDLNEIINHDKAHQIMEDFKQLQSEIEQQEVTLMMKLKTLLSFLLYQAGAFIINTGLFVMETAGIITVLAIRMVGHLGRETAWACKEIGKSFNHRMIQPYKTK